MTLLLELQASHTQGGVRVAERGISSAPEAIERMGTAAVFAWEEFFLGRLRNGHTRMAYARSVKRFVQWCEAGDIDLVRITPGAVGRYFDELPLAVPSKKLHLAAIRSFFDVLVQRHVLVLNPAHSVRTERYVVVEGKTPEITVAQSRQLLASIPIHSLIDLRDRTVIGVLIYTAARAGAVAKLRLADLVDEGTQRSLHFAEKNGKERCIPVRHDLELILRAYMEAARLDLGPKESPFFRSVDARTGKMTVRAMTGVDICRMVKKRLQKAGLPTIISPHSFRSTVATDLLSQGVPLEDVSYLLGHSDTRTTSLYDRRHKRITRNTVERISI